MGLELEIYKDYYDDGVDLYTSDKLVLNPNVVTTLVGCNGSGKTTLIHQIKEKLDKSFSLDDDSDIKVMYFNNLSDGGNYSLERAMFRGDTSGMATLWSSSEGERISNNVGNEIFSNLAYIINNNSYGKIVVLLDAVDSGLDITNIDEIVTCFKDLAIAEAKKLGIELYIVISTNSYEFCIENDCIDITSLEHIEVNSYDEYRDLIIKSDEHKMKRYDDINAIKKKLRSEK